MLAVSPASFVQAHAQNGAFAEPNGTADALLTSWAVLGLRAVGRRAPGSLAYLQSQERSLQSPTDIALVALAEQALGARHDALLARLPRRAERADRRRRSTRRSGACSRSAARPATTRFLLAHQARRLLRVVTAWEPDSNDTAAALEALRVARVTARRSRARFASCARRLRTFIFVSPCCQERRDVYQ